MPENKRESEPKLSFQQILELIGRPQNEQNAANRAGQLPQKEDNRPSREVVLKVIEGLKQV